jgi:hypothetical protein
MVENTVFQFRCMLETGLVDIFRQNWVAQMLRKCEIIPCLIKSISQNGKINADEYGFAARL